MIPNYTLCYILNKDQVLLGMKKRRFGKGRWNGFGGRVEEEDKSVEIGTVREVKEEVGLIVDRNNLELVGEILFTFTEKPELTRKVHIFLAKQWQGEPTETEEMKPEWFNFKAIPYNDMWSVDEEILPRLLMGERIKGEVTHNNESNREYKANIITI